MHLGRGHNGTAKLSIFVPLYNEAEFIQTILGRIIRAPWPAGLEREIIVVDDASTDGSAELVDEVAARHHGLIRLIRCAKNRGKGAAVRVAIEHAGGDYCLIPGRGLGIRPPGVPVAPGTAAGRLGRRGLWITFSQRRPAAVLYYWHSVANHALTTLCNIISNLNLTDMETCYKAFRVPLLKSIPIRSDRFGIEPEITIKVAKRHARIYEVPVSYSGRTYDEGKKIGLKDAFQALGVMLRFWFTSDLYKDPGDEILDAFSVAPRFNRWMADAIRPHLKSRVLEIGAGMGNLTRVLARGCQSYIASDIDGEHLSRLKTRMRHHRTWKPALVIFRTQSILSLSPTP